MSGKCCQIDGSESNHRNLIQIYICASSHFSISVGTLHGFNLESFFIVNKKHLLTSDD